MKSGASDTGFGSLRIMKSGASDLNWTTILITFISCTLPINQTV